MWTSQKKIGMDTSLFSDCRCNVYMYKLAENLLKWTQIFY